MDRGVDTILLNIFSSPIVGMVLYRRQIDRHQTSFIIHRYDQKISTFYENHIQKLNWSDLSKISHTL